MCQSKEDIIANGGKVIENDNGTVTVFISSIGGLIPNHLTKSCCEALVTELDELGNVVPVYTFDIDEQECRWSADCSVDNKPFKVVMNPMGNDGVIFDAGDKTNEDCTLTISFDYLIKLDCDTILSTINENSVDNIGETQDPNFESYIEADRYKSIIKELESQIQILNDELNNTPYVITCESGKITEVGADIVYNPNEELDPIGGKVINKLEIGFGLTGRNYPLSASRTRKYCLTESGLLRWREVIGVNNYNAWLNSNGVDTTHYNCSNVDELLEIDGNSGSLLGSCDINITSRDEIIKQINIYQSNLKEAESEYNQLQTRIEALEGEVPCSTVTDILESIDLHMTLDVESDIGDSLETVFSEELINIGIGGLTNYLVEEQPNTGFLISGETGSTACDTISNRLMEELSETLVNYDSTEIENLVQNSLTSEWLNFETTISDPIQLEKIYNKEIKFSFLVNNCCIDFGILVDRIKLTKNCETIESEQISIAKNPSFNMVRVRDNKKSWLSNEDLKHRVFDLKYRDTQYDIDNYKLAINSKEVDLDINPANAIEQDVFCFIQDNPTILDCSTGETSTTVNTDIDFEQILIDNITNCGIEINTGCTLISSWTIDVKLDCDVVYSGVIGVSGETPTQLEYINLLTDMSEHLGLTMVEDGNTAIITGALECNNEIYLNKELNIDLNLELTTRCDKQFEDGEVFNFEDGTYYEFD